MPITATDFDYVCDFVYKQSAIVLEAGKEYLVEARLGTLARTVGLDDAGAVVKAMRANSDPSLSAKVVDAMTTNETSFLRDLKPFETLTEVVIPELIEKRRAQRSLNIWSAACSTGQEPYTIAMLIRDKFPELKTWTVRILATDLCTEALATAKNGRYSQIEVNRGLPAPMLVKYFDRAGMGWQIKPDLKQGIEFRQMNLVRPWQLTGKMDVIFCRNVLIYFDVATKRDILNRIHQQLTPDGFFFFGAAESMVNLSESFQRLEGNRAGCFRRL